VGTFQLNLFEKKIMKKPTLDHTPSQSISLSTADGPLTVPELAQHFRVSKNWVYEQTRTHALPCLRLGKKNIRFLPCHVAEISEMFNSPTIPEAGK